MTGRPDEGGEDPGRPPALLRSAPVLLFATLTFVTLVLAIMGESLQIIVAPLTSSVVFAFGLAIGEPDVVFLAWLDQGTNLILLEAENFTNSILIVTVSVVVVLVMADFANLAMASRRYGGTQGLKQARYQLPRLAVVGFLSSVLALGGLSLAPVVVVPASLLFVVALIVVAAMVAIVVVGSTDP